MLLTLEAFAVWAVAPLAMLAVSVIYFYKSPVSEPRYRRALVSSPGLVGAALFSAAWFVPMFIQPSPAFRAPYLVSWAVPVGLLVFCLLRFAGPRSVHLLLPVLAAAMLWAVLVGSTVVGGGK